MLFHPSSYDGVAGELVPIAGWWTAPHALQFVLFAMVGLSVWMLVDGLSGVAGMVAKVAALVFVLFYDVGDAAAGITTGILAGRAASGALGEGAAVEAIEALFADPKKNPFFGVGIYAWVVALAAVAMAPWRGGASRLPLVLPAPAASFLSFDHAFPFGSLAFAFFFLAAAWIAPDRSADAPAAREPSRVV